MILVGRRNRHRREKETLWWAVGAFVVIFGVMVSALIVNPGKTKPAYSSPEIATQALIPREAEYQRADRKARKDLWLADQKRAAAQRLAAAKAAAARKKAAEEAKRKAWEAEQRRILAKKAREARLAKIRAARLAEIRAAKAREAKQQAAKKRQKPKRVYTKTRTRSVRLPAVAACIRKYESGGDYRAQNPRSSASGAYQFLDSTWEAVTGLSGSAKDYSKSTQDAAFVKLWDNGRGSGHWVTAHKCGY